ncbi:phage holin family protein [Adlercreutzia sp. R25]|uniref:Phage holin family protein n=1 Tax=Adlercreutzia shanghongiae TaxID=3111773 RepID=A0ABU6IX18_9ACTN|nr:MULTISPECIES: phage holin family protein [unclassified Adlercreutzia]MEC4272478.1 phage holin family protein [Adlercreutzia sp. R25]MEC4294340.1 phage holin family protein [Adlercreutzia sp. R22]
MTEIYIDWHPLAVAAVMMLLDIATGFAGAAKNGVIDSGKMRDGIWHKAGFCCLLVLAAVYEVAVVWIDFEAAQAGFGVAVPDIPAVGIMCAYIVLTELVSVLENLCVLNPDIANFPFVGRLGKHNPAAPDVTVGIEDIDDMAFNGRGE